MNSDSQFEKLRRATAAVLGLPEQDVTDETSPDTAESWDSVTHLNLVMAVEEAFGVSFTPEETMEMSSVKLIRMLIEEKTALVARP